MRAYASYLRLCSKPDARRIQSVAMRLAKFLRLRGEATLPVQGTLVCVDLQDFRSLWALDELRGEHPIARFLERELREGDTFLDVGANHGSYSLLACQLVGQSGRVIAFEPQPILARLLRKSFAANAFWQGAAHEVACIDQCMDLTFYIPSTGSGSAGVHRLFSGTAGHRRLTVQGSTLDSRLEGVALPGKIIIKLDVEGSELLFLKGAIGLLSTRRPVVVFELNPQALRASGATGEHLLDAFESLGYRFALLDQHPMIVDRAQVNCQRQQDLVAIPVISASGG